MRPFFCFLPACLPLTLFAKSADEPSVMTPFTIGHIVGMMLLIAVLLLWWNRSLAKEINRRKKAEEELARAKEELVKRNTELRQINLDLALRVKEEIDKYAEQQSMMIQQSKMAAMGEMIGVIAHQWKQPLNIISLYVQGLDDMVELDEIEEKRMLKISKTVMGQVLFMSDTIQDFRNFFEPSKVKVSFDVVSSCQQVARLLEPQFKRMNIVIEIDELDVCNSYGYPNEFKQVILNLFNNARDVFEERRIKKPRIDVHFRTFEKYCEIRVSDNGGGIPEHLLPDRLFGAYVTTKGEKGTGIGLQISKTIIEINMGGTIQAVNAEEGAEIILRLPVKGTSKKPRGS